MREGGKEESKAVYDIGTKQVLLGKPTSHFGVSATPLVIWLPANAHLRK